MRKGIRIAVYVVLAFTLVYFGAEWFLAVKIRSWVEETVAEVTHGGVRAEVGSVSVRLIARAVWLNDVKISSDTVALNRWGGVLESADGYFKRLGARGVRFRRGDSVICLRFRELDVDVSRFSADVVKRDSVGRFSVGAMPGLQVRFESVRVRSGVMDCRVMEGKDSVCYRLDGFVGRVADGEFSTVSESGVLPFSCRDVRLAFSFFQYRFAGGACLLEVDSLCWQGEEGRLAVGGVRLLPQYGMYEFARRVPGHPDWTRVEVSGLQATGMDLRRFFAERYVSVDSVSLEKVVVSSFKNRQVEQVPRVKRLFYESVQRFPFPLSVRRVALQYADVEYMELAKHGLTPGRVAFNGLRGMFYDVGNRGRFFTLKAEGRLMNQGKVQAVFRFPASRLSPFFEVEGRLGSMNLAALNPMIEPLAKVRVVSGRMEEMIFSMRGDARRAEVDMSFLYEKLRIRIMREKDGRLEPRSFLTMLANGLVVRGSNPDYGGLRRVEAWAERDPYRSQFNYLWKVLFAGIKESVGM